MVTLPSHRHSAPRRIWDSDMEQRRPPRLPTPSTSRSSCDGSEGGSPHIPRLPAVTARFSCLPPLHCEPLSREETSDDAQRDGREPESGYRYARQHQPHSLPPLKLVLEDSFNLSSPPETPDLPCTPSQPCPREPSFTQTTFRPPSLYPNKKPKFDGPFERPHAWAGRSSSSNRRTPARSPASLSRMSTRDSDMGSTPLLDEASTRHSYERSYPTSRYSPYSSSGSFSTSPHHYELEPPPVSYADRIDDRYSRPALSPPMESGREPGGYFDIRRQAPSGTDAVHRMAYAPPTSTGASRHWVVAAAPQLPPLHAGFVASHYENEPATYFVPRPYDCPPSKARKRSNLPRESTEIMKSWFDSNIHNPYPSEEQKAMFSHATGISMTQVSNWFINHRRRCPELRDKRERGRGDEDAI